VAGALWPGRRTAAGRGIATTPDHEAGARRYITLRREWNPAIVALAAYMAYDWSAVAPADSGQRTGPEMRGEEGA